MRKDAPEHVVTITTSAFSGARRWLPSQGESLYEDGGDTKGLVSAVDTWESLAVFWEPVFGLESEYANESSSLSSSSSITNGPTVLGRFAPLS
jgi:hypothetical protein